MQNPASPIPVALITGASRGIGAALAREFASRGHNVAIAARDTEALARIRDEIIERYGVVCAALKLDITAPNAVADVVAALHEHGVSVETLVNNAAVWTPRSMSQEAPDEISRLVQANIAFPTALTVAVLPMVLAANRGGILNVGSLAGAVPSSQSTIYAASKAYLASSTLGLARELTPKGVNVSLLMPGLVDTSFTVAEGCEQPTPLRRLLASSPEAVARAGYVGLMAGQRIISPGPLTRIVRFGLPVLPRRVTTGLRDLAQPMSERRHSDA